MRKREEWKVETRKREEGKEGKKRETTTPKLTIFSQRQLPLMVYCMTSGCMLQTFSMMKMPIRLPGLSSSYLNSSFGISFLLPLNLECNNGITFQ